MPNITQLGRVMVPVADQDEAIAFYTEKLGFSVTADIPFAEGERWVEVSPPGGGASFALVPPQGQFQPGRMTGIGLESGDVAALHAELQEAGVEVEEMMGGAGGVPPLFMFRDNNGNHLMVAQPQEQQ